MNFLNSSKDDEHFSRRSAYGSEGAQRYPDSADLLPISVDARIFEHRILNQALIWI
jgi:hypothetical protein